MPYEPDLREELWGGHSGHEHARPYDPADTRFYNDGFKAQERERTRKVAEQEAKAQGRCFAWKPAAPRAR